MNRNKIEYLNNEDPSNLILQSKINEIIDNININRTVFVKLDVYDLSVDRTNQISKSISELLNSYGFYPIVILVISNKYDVSILSDQEIIKINESEFNIKDIQDYTDSKIGRS